MLYYNHKGQAKEPYKETLMKTINERDEYMKLVNVIGEKQFRKNVMKWEPDVNWSAMTLDKVINELIAFGVDSTTFDYKK